MKTPFAKLAAAAVALAAAPAAFPCDGPAPHGGVRVTVAAAPVPPPPAPLVRVDDRWDDDAHRWDRGDRRWDRDDRWRHDRDGDGWRRQAWRAEEQARLRAGYARLDDARRDFYARPHRGWEVRRFEGWYAHERAELDGRWSRLAWVAAR